MERTLETAAHAIAATLHDDPNQRADRLGEIFLACRKVAKDRPEEFHAALEQDALEPFLLAHVTESLDPSSGSAGSRGGWLGTYVDSTGRDIEHDGEDTTDQAALELSSRALRRALALAREQGNETLLRNLGWYGERLAHKSYDAIARENDRPPATIRTGVARARKFVLRVVHELQHAQPAPLSGDAPAEVAPLRDLWVRQDLEALDTELERTRSEFSDDPHWLNLAALLAADRGRAAEAAEHYERGLVFADAPEVRGRILNNLGNLVAEQGRVEDARPCWMRAHQLVPNAPAPLMNLIADASLAQDYATAQLYLSELGELLSADRLNSDERDYVRRRLEDNPKLGWLRATDAWRKGPARWLRAWRRPVRVLTPLIALAASAMIAAWTLLGPSVAFAGVATHEEPRAFDARPVAWIELAQKGGDSMGGPRKRNDAPTFAPLLAGDTMGRDAPPSTGKPSKGG